MASKLKKKQSRVTELGRLISMHDRPLSREESGKIQHLQDSLEFTLRELEEKGAEAKVETMEKVLDILKKKDD